MPTNHYDFAKQEHSRLSTLLSRAAILIGPPENQAIPTPAALGLTEEAQSLARYTQVTAKTLFTIALLDNAQARPHALLRALLRNTMFMGKPLSFPLLIRFGQSSTVLAYEADRPAPHQLPWAMFNQKLLTDTWATAYPRLNYVQLERQFAFLANHIQIFYLPFSSNERQQQFLQNFIRIADATVIGLDNTTPLTPAQQHILTSLFGNQRRANLFFAIQIKELPSPGPISLTQVSAKQVIRPFFIDTSGRFDEQQYTRRVFAVEPSLALEARLERPENNVQLNLSHLPLLETSLADFLTEKTLVAQKLAPLRTRLHSSLTKALSHLSSEKARVPPQRLVELRAIEQQLHTLAQQAQITLDITTNIPAIHNISSGPAVSKNSPTPQAGIIVEKTQSYHTTRTTRKSARRADEPDPLEVWIDINDHLDFATQLIERSEIPQNTRVEIGNSLQLIRKRKADSRLYMAVVGEFSSGKSTFLNALLRQELLATSVLPTTAAQTRFLYGPELDLQVTFTDSSEPLSYQKHGAQLRQKLKKLASDQATSDADLQTCLHLVTANETIAAHVAQVTICHPTPFLMDDIVIIDTPGINTENERHAQITYQLIEKEIDAAVVIIPAPIPLASTLTTFLTTHFRSSLQHCIFVVTQMDKIRPKEQDRLLQNLRLRLKEALNLKGEPILYPCAPQIVLDALIDHASLSPEQLSWDQRFIDLEDALFEHLQRERVLSIARNLLRLMDKLLHELEDYLQERQAQYEQRQAFIEKNTIRDLASFTQAQQTRYTTQLKHATAQAQEALADCIETEQDSTEGAIRAAIFGATDSTLGQVISNKAQQLFEESTETIVQELQEQLTKLSEVAQEAADEIDEEFDREYERLERLSSVLVSHDPTPSLHVSSDVADALNAAQALHKNLSNKEGQAIGGGLLSGLVLGTMLIPIPVVGSLIGLFAGGWLGAKMGPSLSKRQNDLWAQLEPQISPYFTNLSQEIENKLQDHVKQLRSELKKRINDYRKRYQTTVDAMVSDQQASLKELTQLQNILQKDLQEIKRRRDLLQKKRKELEQHNS